MKNITTLLMDRTILVSLFLGFSSGLPLALSGATLQAWYASSSVSLLTISFVGSISIPYTLKFFWAPLLDRYVPPFLGRRRGWILIFQLLLALTIITMAFLSPENEPTLLMAMAGLAAFFASSQDIVIDAYRVEILTPNKRALGAAMAVNGYRLAMLVSGGLGLVIADNWGFKTAYLLMAVLAALGAIVTFMGPEPQQKVEIPRRLKDCLILPFIDFFSRPQAIWILIFIIAYKLGDAFAGSLVFTFLIREIHMSLSEIGILIKLLGFLGTIMGTVLGALYIPKLGWFPALFIFGVLQAIANLIYIPLLWTGPNYIVAGIAIFVDNISGGMGTAAFVGLLMGFCNARFTAFQYALLSALGAVGRVFVGPVAAVIAENYGWKIYFISSVMFAIPGLLLLLGLKKGLMRMSEELKEQ
jgi:PAT family beta-lactamase induction signal transducer AmpG